MVEALAACGLTADRLLLIGGAAPSPAVQTVLTQMVEIPVVVPEPDEYVTKGAAMQAASTLTGRFPQWPVAGRTLDRTAHETAIEEQHQAAMTSLGYVDETLGRAVKA
jgi:xylulokinase